MYAGGGAWGPALTGWLSDLFGGGARGLTYALIITCASSFVAFICWWQTSKYYPADVKKADAI